MLTFFYAGTILSLIFVYFFGRLFKRAVNSLDTCYSCLNTNLDS